MRSPYLRSSSSNDFNVSGFESTLVNHFICSVPMLAKDKEITMSLTCIYRVSEIILQLLKNHTNLINFLIFTSSEHLCQGLSRFIRQLLLCSFRRETMKLWREK